MCQRARRYANVSTWHANVLNGVPIFQPAMATCQRAVQFFKHSSYEMLREMLYLYKKFYIILDIILIHIICICIVHITCIILYFQKLFCSLDRNRNIKTPGFYRLQVTTVFSNFSQLKQLNKIKNTCEYCDLLELWSASVGDPR